MTALAASPPVVRRFFHSDRAATDPILVIAAIAVSLVLLVGGSFTVTALLGNGKDLNAKNDLSRVVVAENAFRTQADAYTGTVGLLSASGVSTSFTSASSVGIRSGTGCFAAFSLSETGKTFFVTSASTTPKQVTTPWPAGAPTGYPTGCAWPSSATDALTSQVTNLLNPTVPSAPSPFESEWGGAPTGTVTFRSDASIDKPYQRNTFTGNALNDGHALVASPRGAGGVIWKTDTKYTWSEWVRPSVDVHGYSPTMFFYGDDGNVYSDSNGHSETLPANKWTQITATFTSPSQSFSGAWAQFRVNSPAVTAFTTGTTLDVTKAMLVEGDTLYEFGNADSSGWTTTGSGGSLVASGPARAQ